MSAKLVSVKKKKSELGSGCFLRGRTLSCSFSCSDEPYRWVHVVHMSDGISMCLCSEEQDRKWDDPVLSWSSRDERLWFVS